jgi:hypothetical protein
MWKTMATLKEIALSRLNGLGLEEKTGQIKLLLLSEGLEESSSLEGNFTLSTPLGVAVFIEVNENIVRIKADFKIWTGEWQNRYDDEYDLMLKYSLQGFLSDWEDIKSRITEVINKADTVK